MTDIPSERRVLARAVKAEVDAIFGAAPQASARAASKIQPLARPAAPRTSRAASVGVSVALALAGIAVGALLTRNPSPASEAPASAPSPTPPGSLEVVLTPQAPVTPLVIEPTPEPPKAKAAPQPQARPKAGSGDCAAPGGRRCSYSVVLAADSALRRAYRRAGQAGVSARELAAFRSRWNRLRRAGAYDPDRVVRGYRGMASDLNRLARERRA